MALTLVQGKSPIFGNQWVTKKTAYFRPLLLDFHLQQANCFSDMKAEYELNLMASYHDQSIVSNLLVFSSACSTCSL